MARTIAEITAALHNRYPTLTALVDGQTITLDATAYEARIAEMAANVRQQELEAEAEAADANERSLLRAAAEALQDDIAALEGSGTLTNRQQRDMLARTDRILLRLGRVLVKKGIL